jgi:hypothetical protein
LKEFSLVKVCIATMEFGKITAKSMKAVFLEATLLGNFLINGTARDVERNRRMKGRVKVGNGFGVWKCI